MSSDSAPGKATGNSAEAGLPIAAHTHGVEAGLPIAAHTHGVEAGLPIAARTHRAEAGLRIRAHTRGAAIEFRFDGRTVAAYEGESVACALFAAGVRTLRLSPRSGAARGMFCLMGSCQECVVWVDGRRVPACQEPARAGLDVRSGTIAAFDALESEG